MHVEAMQEIGAKGIYLKKLSAATSHIQFEPRRGAVIGIFDAEESGKAMTDLMQKA